MAKKKPAVPYTVKGLNDALSAFAPSVAPMKLDFVDAAMFTKEMMTKMFSIPAGMLVGDLEHQLSKSLLVHDESHFFASPKLKKSTYPYTVIEDDDTISPEGVAVLTEYAIALGQGRRELQLERQYPELTDTFMDIRLDPDFAARWSAPLPEKSVLIVKSSAPHALGEKMKAAWYAQMEIKQAEADGYVPKFIFKEPKK